MNESVPVSTFNTQLLHKRLRLYLSGVGQRGAPAVELLLPKGSPNVRADLTVQLSPPDARGESSGGSRSRGGGGGISSDFQDYFILLHARPQAGTYSAWVWVTAGACGEPKEDRLNDAVLDGEKEGAGGGMRGSLLRPKKRLNL